MRFAFRTHIVPIVHDTRSCGFQLNQARNALIVNRFANGLERAFLNAQTVLGIRDLTRSVESRQHIVRAFDKHGAHATRRNRGVIGDGLLLVVCHHGCSRRFNKAVFQRERTEFDFGKHRGFREVVNRAVGKIPILRINLRIRRHSRRRNAA